MAIVEIDVTEEMTLSVTPEKIKVYKGVNDPEEIEVTEEDVLKLTNVAIMQNTGMTPFRFNKVEPKYGVQGIEVLPHNGVDFPSRDAYILVPDVYSYQFVVDKDV